MSELESYYHCLSGFSEVPGVHLGYSGVRVVWAGAIVLLGGVVGEGCRGHRRGQQVCVVTQAGGQG